VVIGLVNLANSSSHFLVLGSWTTLEFGHGLCIATTVGESG
jgi:hypothetical protein